MIASIQKAIKILTLVADGRSTPTPLCEISERTGINKSTCSRIIGTLVHEGFLVKISSSKGYVLGPAAYCLSRFGRYGSDLISVCHPVMQYLYKTLGYCVVLAVTEGREKYVIDYIDDGRIFENKQKIMRDDIYRTATGRTILKNMSKKEIYAVWEKYGKPSEKEWAEICSLEDLLSYAASDRDRDMVAVRSADGDRTIVFGYSVPIKRGARCVAALGIAVKIELCKEKEFVTHDDPNIRKLLLKAADVISERL